jgi:hypothetical protein
MAKLRWIEKCKDKVKQYEWPREQDSRPRASALIGRSKTLIHNYKLRKSKIFSTSVYVVCFCNAVVKS